MESENSEPLFYFKQFFWPLITNEPVLFTEAVIKFIYKNK